MTISLHKEVNLTQGSQWCCVLTYSTSHYVVTFVYINTI